MSEDGVYGFLAGVVAVFIVALIFFIGQLSVSNSFDFSQRAFPCAEDEVLGYTPGVPDHVVCFHRDALR